MFPRVLGTGCFVDVSIWNRLHNSFVFVCLSVYNNLFLDAKQQEQEDILQVMNQQERKL